MPSIITCRASKLILQADSTNVRLGRVIHANRMLIDRKQLSIFNRKKQILIDFLLVWTGILQQCLFCNVWWWAYSVSLSMRRYFYILKLTNERLEWGHSLTPRPHFVWQWFGKSRIEQKWQKCAEECQDNSVQDNFRPHHVNTRLGQRLTNQRPRMITTDQSEARQPERLRHSDLFQYSKSPFTWSDLQSLWMLTRSPIVCKMSHAGIHCKVQTL